MRSVVIVVPIYKSTISYLESVSLKQLNKIFKKHEICFIAPNWLKNVSYNIYNYSIERFSNSYFKDIPSYSRLMMSTEFYDRFENHEYMLIYQLDAFVFSDKLQYFCEMDFDYIGAPHPKHGIYWGKLGQVGNGGLSLRKICACKRVVKQKEMILKNHPLSDVIKKAEDLFFAYCGRNSSIQFKVPSPRVALKFSISNDCLHALKDFSLNENFGCHAWYKCDYIFWKKVIESQGYSLPELEKCANRSSRMMLIYHNLKNRISRNQNIRRSRERFREILPLDSYIIWGLGEMGKRVVDILKEMQIEISLIYEKKIEGTYHEIPVVFPSKEHIVKNDRKILITTIKYQDEISRYLEDCGKKEGRDFFLYDKIEKALIYRLYHFMYHFSADIEYLTSL